MSERLEGYFATEDEAQRAVPLLRAAGVRDITVERLDSDERERGAVLFPIGNHISSASVVPATGSPPNRGVGLFGDAERGYDEERKRYLLECLVTSEQAPRAIAILLEHGASLERS